LAAALRSNGNLSIYHFSRTGIYKKSVGLTLFNHMNLRNTVVFLRTIRQLINIIEFSGVNKIN
jgi:hypothetical protein